MSATDDSTDEHQDIEAAFTDLEEGTLAADEMARVRAHLDTCERCAASYKEFKDTLRALSGLHKMSAPEHLKDDVAETIKRRSGGRFFGRRAFGDRVPFEVLAVVAMVVAVAIYLYIRSSATGSFRPFERKPDAPSIHEHAKDVVPKP
jgi:anti-sigma factor RsiW